jgi:hypothetical protein
MCSRFGWLEGWVGDESGPALVGVSEVKSRSAVTGEGVGGPCVSPAIRSASRPNNRAEQTEREGRSGDCEAD